MQPRPLLLLGAACAMALGCAGHPLPYHEQSLPVNASGSDPWGPGGTRARITGVLEARHYTVQHFDMRTPHYAWYLPTRWAPWGIRLRADGWDQIDVMRASEPLEDQLPPLSYRWTVRARTFASDGAERPASAEARADADSIMAGLGTVDTLEGASGATRTGPEWWRVGREARLRTCAGGVYVGALTALPPWAGAPDKGTNAERITATLEAGGWTIARRFPVAELGMLVAERPQSAGADGLTVFAIRPEDPSRYGTRTWYEVRAASCDSTGRRAPPRPEARADADRLITALQHVLAVGP